MLQAARHTVTRARVGMWHHQRWHGRGLWYGLLFVWLMVAVNVTVLFRTHVPHPTLARSCYAREENHVHPRNTCCRTLNYTARDVGTCIRNAAREVTLLQGTTSPEEEPHFHSPNEYLVRFKQSSPRTLPTPEGTASQSKDFPGWSWVVAGDSRMRQVFSALVTRLSGPRLKYKKPSTQDKWRSIHELLEPLRIGKLHEDIELYHMDLPIHLQFYWDPMLQRMPKLVQEWQSNNKTPPSLLLLGTGLHWMKNSLDTYNAKGHDLAMNTFREHMKDLIPQLDHLSQSTNIIIQLQDHVQESQIFQKYQGIYSNLNIDRYNNHLRSMISSSKITLWDSNIPFSEEYVSQCTIHQRRTIDKAWDCDNPLHTGYIMVEEYANMILNDVCNPYLQLGEAFC